MTPFPEHHIHYQRAWALYQDPGLSDEARSVLEREMDSAQDAFRYDEFQAFKETLPGFLDFWRDKRNDLIRAARAILPKP